MFLNENNELEGKGPTLLSKRNNFDQIIYTAGFMFIFSDVSTLFFIQKFI